MGDNIIFFEMLKLWCHIKVEIQKDDTIYQAKMPVDVHAVAFLCVMVKVLVHEFCGVKSLLFFVWCNCVLCLSA